MTTALRVALTVSLLVAMPAAACAQFDFPKISGPGPSGAQVAGVIGGVAAATGLILYFTLRKPAIVGCVQSADGTSSLIDERDKRTYSLAGNSLNLKAGERLKLKGKKIKEKEGKFTFRVKKVVHDYGACNQ